MAVNHSIFNDKPNPTVEYHTYWRVLNKRMISAQNQGYAITSNLLKAMMLDSESYLRSRRKAKNLGIVLGELEDRGIEGIPTNFLKPRKKLETTTDIRANNLTNCDDKTSNSY
jgi:hypothetical protein